MDDLQIAMACIASFGLGVLSVRRSSLPQKVEMGVRMRISRRHYDTAEEYLGGARLSLEEGCIRNACASAFFAMYHTVMTGVYAHTRLPVRDEGYHEYRSRELLIKVLNATKIRDSRALLLENLKRVQELEHIADYEYDEGRLSPEKAEFAIDCANELKRVIWATLPPEAQPHVYR